ncbi:uncharacterized protein LOC132030544 [Lycium ferocissimum]|uniref:uncharacterized protein LOC132030544 n=1 Tax=Lycium ferocissimum TaxID=112874 RepID=UPI002814E456|nr:uncharacterized protein LOC132030544 [Lycium ferocissimum]
MWSEQKEIPPPPGFEPLDQILPTEDNSDDHDKGERTTTPDPVIKRCSSRKRTRPNFFVPTHPRPSPRPHDQGLQRGRGRPRKQRSDDEMPSTETTENPGSQSSLRRGPGRPPKQRSNVTEAPAVSPPPASPLGSTEDSPLALATTNTPEAVAPTQLESTRDSPLVSETANTPEAVAPTTLGSTGDSPLVSATANTPKAVAPTSLGSTSDRPLEVPSDEEDTKLNVKLSRVLMHPPKANHKPQIPDEESKKVILGVGSLLVKKLLTSENDVGYMVHQANAIFTCLKALDVDYASFYGEVTEYISHRCNLLDAQREEAMLSLPALQENYENAKSTAIDVEEDFGHTQGEWAKAKKKEETLKRKIEDLKQELAQIEHKKESLKEAHEVAKAKEQELGTQLKAAQARRTEIQQRKYAALVGIESTTQRLKSTYHVDFD